MTPGPGAHAIPLVDIAPLRGPAGAARAAAVEAIGAACRDVGFLTVVGHGVDPTLRAEAFAAAHRFFALDDATKASVAMDHDGPFAERGFDGIGRQRLDGAARPDQKESFNIGPELPADHPLVVAETPMHGPNRWLPEPVLPGFRSVVGRYQDALTDVARRLLGAMAEALDLAPDAFDPFLTVPAGALRLVHYPPRRTSAAADEFGAGAHTDWGVLTVLAQDDAGGLQVQAADGTWLDATPRPDALVVNIGDLMDRWTNGRFRSTRHRVLGAPTDRYSIVLFHDLDWEATIECLPTCAVAGRPARYPPITVGAHLLEKFEASVVGTPSA